MTSYVTPMCMVCARFDRDGPGLTCEAYPRRIPDAILESRADHRLPQPGDGGKQFVLRAEERNTPPENRPGLLRPGGP